MLFGLSTPVALAVLVYFGYALIAFRERDLSSTAEGPADPRPRRHPDRLGRHHRRHRAVPGRLGELPHARRRRRRRAGAQPDRHAEQPGLGAAVAGPGDRPAVGVHVSLPGLRRRRDAAPRAAGQPPDRVPRHLAGRHPLLLGLPARRQGRRQPRRGQRRLRGDAQADELRHPLRGAVRGLARLHVRHRPRGLRRATSRAGSLSNSARSRRRPSSWTRTRRPTSRIRRGEVDERHHGQRRRHAGTAAPARLQPVDRDRAVGRWAW